MMARKLLVLVGAGAFAAITLAIFVLQLPAMPEAPRPEADAIWEPDGDPLAAQLRACSEMSELALSLSDCRAVWAEKRRRFFGFEDEASEPASEPDIEATEAASPSADREEDE